GGVAGRWLSPGCVVVSRRRSAWTPSSALPDSALHPLLHPPGLPRHRLAGYFVDDWAELLGALVLTAGMWTVALLTWRDVRACERDRFTRGLLAVSAAVLVATMVLALSWALGEATGLPHPNLTWMAATHGLGNALGFALCSVLAWRRLKEKAA
ncbi:YndJ family transporter, partial [Streptomyces lunaelactis]|nr:YndJ family transporter [Streptomyces lunaelactis]